MVKWMKRYREAVAPSIFAVPSFLLRFFREQIRAFVVRRLGAIFTAYPSAQGHLPADAFCVYEATVKAAPSRRTVPGYESF
jgi:hypothetical protein